MKQQFINQLKDNTDVSENRHQLNQLLKEFPELPKEIPKEMIGYIKIEKEHRHRWTIGYFLRNVDDLERTHFSKELAEHLIEVKSHLQAKGEFSQNSLREEASNLNLTQEEKLDMSNHKTSISQDKINKPDLTKFKPDERLRKMLAENNLSHIRTYLMANLNDFSLDLEHIVKSVWYVWESKKEVFQEEEDSVFVSAIDHNEAHWNKDYFSIQQTYLNRNFSLVRLLHLINVREKLMNKGDPNFQKIHRTKSGNKGNVDDNTIIASNKTNEENGKSNNDFVKTALLVGGAVLCMATFLFVLLK